MRSATRASKDDEVAGMIAEIFGAIISRTDSPGLLVFIEMMEKTIMYRRGEVDGEAAASWIIDGNTDDPAAVLKRLIDGIDDGDPMILDNLPAPRLSGEYADDQTFTDILGDELQKGFDPGDDSDYLLDSYREGFDHGVEAEIRRMYTAYTAA